MTHLTLIMSPLTHANAGPAKDFGFLVISLSAFLVASLEYYEEKLFLYQSEGGQASFCVWYWSGAADCVAEILYLCARRTSTPVCHEHDGDV